MKRICGLVLVLFLGSCATRPGAPPSLPRDDRQAQTSLPVPEQISPSPANYVARAGSYDQLVVRASELVAQSGGDPATLRLAAMLAEDHRGLAAQLSFAGRRLDLLPSATLVSPHDGWFSSFETAADRPTAFRQLMRRVHQNSYAMHAAMARSGSSPTLRAVAVNAVSAERRHWAELNR